MPDSDAASQLAMIKSARGLNVPDTDEQRDWVIALGGTLARTARSGTRD